MSDQRLVPSEPSEIRPSEIRPSEIRTVEIRPTAPDIDPESDAPLNGAEAAVCGNCNTILNGPYCHQCGQRVQGPIRELLGLIRDGIDEFVALDGKLWKSLWPLYFRPGHLTRRYLQGQRVSFIRPLRLYLALSITLFLLMSCQTNVTNDKTGSQPGVRSGIQLDISDEERAEFAKSEPISINLNGKPWHTTDNPIEFAWLPTFVNRSLNSNLAHIQGAPAKIAADPTIFTSALYRILPTALFFLLPFGAALLKVVYLFRKRLYAEHLLVAVQCHSFLFLSLISLFVVGEIMESLSVYSAAVPMVFGPMLFLAAVWMPIYLWLVFKRIYQQSWWLTSIKFAFVASAYFLLTGLAVMFAILASLASL